MGLGTKVIFVFSSLAVFSVILTWVDMGIAISNGIMQGGFVLLLLYVYPMMRILKNQLINKKPSLGSSFISIIA